MCTFHSVFWEGIWNVKIPWAPEYLLDAELEGKFVGKGWLVKPCACRCKPEDVCIGSRSLQFDVT